MDCDGEPTGAFGDRHPPRRAGRRLPLGLRAHPGADVPAVFRGDIARAWAAFAHTGNPGWPREVSFRW
ncbi:hypothetical protein AB0A63_27500 [Lentzea sp. NPDC042327]|uniref:hypothetical protein n=1 Tax=Lentzea sp. NPDC042327 TaxID=3154801 RepID=UPI0033E42CCF